MASYRKKPCKKSQFRNPKNDICKKKTCKKGSKIKRSTGRCNKIICAVRSVKRVKRKSVVKPRRSARRFLLKDVAEGCRGRTKASCKERSNCSYRKYTGCVKKSIRKKKDEVSAPFVLNTMPDDIEVFGYNELEERARLNHIKYGLSKWRNRLWRSYVFCCKTVLECPECKRVVRRRSAGKFLKKSVAEGECRGRTKVSCNKRPGCSYRKSVGCVKKFGVVKRKYVYAGAKGKSPSGSIRGPRQEDYDNMDENIRRKYGLDDYTGEVRKRMEYALKNNMRYSPQSK